MGWKIQRCAESPETYFCTIQKIGNAESHLATEVGAQPVEMGMCFHTNTCMYHNSKLKAIKGHETFVSGTQALPSGHRTTGLIFRYRLCQIRDSQILCNANDTAGKPGAIEEKRLFTYLNWAQVFWNGTTFRQHKMFKVKTKRTDTIFVTFIRNENPHITGPHCKGT